MKKPEWNYQILINSQVHTTCDGFPNLHIAKNRAESQLANLAAEQAIVKIQTSDRMKRHIFYWENGKLLTKE